MCLFYLHIGCIGQTCNARNSWSAGIDQYLTSMTTVLILVRNACSYYVCMHSVVVVQLPTLTAKEMSPLNTMVSGIYQCLAIIGDIDTTHIELMNAAMPYFVSL